MRTNRFTTGTKNKSSKNTFILLSAGAGRRMTCYGPKCLLKYKSGKTVLDHQIDVIHSFDKTADIILVTGFESKKIVKKSDTRIRIVENKEHAETGNAESLRLGINNAVPSNVYFIHGDIIFSYAAIDFPEKHSAYLYMDSSGMIESTEVGMSIENGRVLNMSYGLTKKWGQIGYIPHNNFGLFRELCNCCDPITSTFELINNIIDKIEFFAYENKRCVIKEIDSLKDLE